MTTLFLLFVVACTAPPIDVVDEQPALDADSDGYTVDEDCDDDNAQINPGADEICDGLDNNCDGVTDGAQAIDQTTWYIDFDTDGFGSDGFTETACDAPDGYVANNDDCDDTNEDNNPDADEVCDEEDNDCDDAIDEDDASGAPVWYRDVDEDLYGDPNDATAACAQPEGYVDNDGDCDDILTDVNPDATEVCDDVDNDCDDAIDEDDASGAPVWYRDVDEDLYGDPNDATAACAQPEGYVDNDGDCDDILTDVNPELVWYADSDSDEYGDPEVAMTSCLQPDDHVANALDCDDEITEINPDATEVCDDVDNDCNDGIDEDDASGAPTWYRDFDEDEYGDPNDQVITCTQPDGYVDNGDDCNDQLSDVNPELVWYADSDTDDYGDPDVSVMSCLQPDDYVAIARDCDDELSEVNPDADELCATDYDDNCDGDVNEGCEVDHCGDIIVDTVWDSTSVHIVTCDIRVYSGATLTVEDGAMVLFDRGVFLQTGSPSAGRLVVDGHTAGVLFTAHTDDPLPGTWAGVYFAGQDSGSALTGLTIEYGGDNGFGNLRLAGPSLTVIDSEVRKSSNHGIYVGSNSLVSIDGSTVTDNAGTGLYLTQGARRPAVADSLFIDNGGFAARVPLDTVSGLGESSTFTPNGDDFVAIGGTSTSVSETWPALDAPYWLEETVYIGGDTTITVSDTAVHVPTGERIFIGRNNSGKMVTDNVVFTSQENVPAAGDYLDIWLGAYDTGSIFTDTVFEYGGGRGYGGVIVTQSPGPQFIGCTFRYSSSDGLNMRTGARATISGNTFTENIGSGIDFWAGGGTAASLMTDNTFTNNGTYPLKMNVNEVHLIDGSSTFGGNGEEAVYVGTNARLGGDRTWQALDVPYFLPSEMYIDRAGAILTLEPGVVMAFAPGSGIRVGSPNTGGGDLIAVGTPDAPILFTSANETPVAGDWNSVFMRSDCDAAVTRLDNVIVEYGGGGGQAGSVRFWGCAAAISNSTVTDSASYGISVDTGTASISNMTYARNALGNVKP